MHIYAINLNNFDFIYEKTTFLQVTVFYMRLHCGIFFFNVNVNVNLIFIKNICIFVSIHHPATNNLPIYQLAQRE